MHSNISRKLKQTIKANEQIIINCEVLNVRNQEINIGKSIKRFRKQRSITQEQLSDCTGLSRSYISDLENNRRDPSLSTLINVSDKLGISLVELLVGK